MTIRNMETLELKDKRVLIRVDFNVPIQDDKITSDTRILASLPTIQCALDKGAAVILISHRGRPKEGEEDPSLSLAPVAAYLSSLLQQPVPLKTNWVHGFPIKAGEVVLCENVRFLKGEKANDESLSKAIAALCDVFVMDAFATAHRAQASTHGVACFAPIACAGLLLMKELDALNRIFKNPERPLTAIVGGAKVSTKLSALNHLFDKVDNLIVGGGIANTFIVAAGNAVGKSLYEPDLVENARKILIEAKEKNVQIPIPVDAVVAETLSNDAQATIKSVSQISPTEMILDIGPQTIKLYQSLLVKSNTILWNGPVGVFEYEPFSAGTEALTKTIVHSNAFTIAGGGDTLAALEKFELQDKISYLSTGGGAFLAFLEGKSLPAIEVLEQRGNELKE